MTKAATPCFTSRIPSASISTITVRTETVGLRALDLESIQRKIHSSCCEIEDFVETRFCKPCVKLRSRVLYFGMNMMHV